MGSLIQSPAELLASVREKEPDAVNTAVVSASINIKFYEPPTADTITLRT